MSTNSTDRSTKSAMSGAMAPADSPLAREVQFLTDLARLAADRAAAESQIEAQFQAAKKSAERALREAQVALDAWLETERYETAADHDELRRHALARYQLENTSHEREQAELQEQVTHEFDEGRRRAERKLQEARWEAETLFDAGKNVAPRQLEEFSRQLDGWRQRIGAELQAAHDLLGHWRQPCQPLSLREPRPSSAPLGLPPQSEAATTSAPPIQAVELASRLQERVNFAAAQRARLAQLRAPGLAASSALLWACVLASLSLSALAAAMGWGAIGAIAALLIAAALSVPIIVYLRRLARSRIDEIYPPLDEAVREGEQVIERALDEAKSRAAAQQVELISRRDRAQRSAEEQYQARMAEIGQQRDSRLLLARESYPRRLAENATRRDRDLAHADETRARREAEIARRQAAGAKSEEHHLRQMEELQQRYAAQWQALADEWQAGLAHLQSVADQIRGDGAEAPDAYLRSDWSNLTSGNYPAATDAGPAIRFGELYVSMGQIPHGMPRDARLAEVTRRGFSLPALLPFPQKPSLLVKAHGSGRQAAIEAMQAIMLRLLVSIPPGKLRFTIVDPVGLGDNFAAFMHLADYNEALVSSRIWTEPRHIEQRLADLSEHMENVIQKYLRNEFQSIEEYNREAGEIAEPFRFLVIANFPANFSEAAQRRLLSIAASGARCGVYTLVMVDTQAVMPTGVALRDLEQHGTTLWWNEGRFIWKDELFGQLELTLDAPPPPAQMTAILHAAGRHAQQASRVEVPFELIAPVADQRWTASARAGIDVPLGRAGATRLQHMTLGEGTSQHVLIAGKTGSGKSTLLHALITNLALRYSPDEIELYLVDFKQGVEFKTYATHRLPHARVVAIESDREFGLSVLSRLDAELKVRADLFRALGVQDLAGYRQADGSTPLPRILLIVDEFQEFFVEDDKLSQDAALLLDRLVRQGRAFGIHILLGSQTLSGTYSLARSTIGQMAVRIALQCSETDAHLILSEENSAARLLSRAGEAIYNDTNGLVEGNHPFQVVWLSDDRREEYLRQVQALAERHSLAPRPQVVFEGNLPADLERNTALAERLRAQRPDRPPSAAQVWLGEAVAIKDPTAITLRPQSGSNLLIMGQNEEAALGIFAAALISLAAQQGATETSGARFYLFDGSPAGSAQAASLAVLCSLTSPPARLVSWRELPAAVGELAMEIERRQKQADTEFPPIYVLIHGLHRLRDLRRQEDDFAFSRPGDQRPPDPARQFSSVLREGPALGVHTLAWCDSVNNLHRSWDRQTLREFEMRVVFQMSGNDSSMLIDTPLAAKLGVYRALLHSEEQGILEKFRPYRWPAESWLSWVRRQLRGPEGQCDSRSRRLAV